MKKMMFLFIVALIFIKQGFSQSLTVTGSWTTSIPSTTIIEAGLDYTSGSSDISSASQSLMTVTTAKNTNAFVYVQKSDISWDTRLTLSVERTGTGTGNNGFSTTNGTVNQAVSNVPQYFFQINPAGGTKVSNIPIRYTITGYTVLLPVKSYTTTVLYTVTN